MTRAEAVRIAKRRSPKPTYRGKWRWQHQHTSMERLREEWCRNVIFWDKVAVEKEEARLLAIETMKQVEREMVVVQGVEVPTW